MVPINFGKYYSGMAYRDSMIRKGKVPMNSCWCRFASKVNIAEAAVVDYVQGKLRTIWAAKVAGRMHVTDCAVLCCCDDIKMYLQIFRDKHLERRQTKNAVKVIEVGATLSRCMATRGELEDG